VAIIAVGMLANYKQLGWDDATLAHFVSKLKGIILGNTDYPLKSMAVQVLGRYATDRLDGAIDALVAISESTAVKDKRVQVEIQALLEQLDIYARSRAIFEGARLDPMTVSPDTIAELGLNVYTAASLLLIAEYGTPLSANRALEKLREVSARLDDAEKAEYAGRILPFLSELKEIGGYDNALLDGLSALFAAGGGGEKESADVFDESSWAKAPRLSIEASDEHYAVEGLTEGEGAAQIKEFVGKTAQKHSWVMLERSDGRTGWYHLGGNDAAVIFGPDPERARKIKRIVFYHLDAGAELLPTLVQRLSSDSLAAVLERPYNAAKRGFSGTVEEVILSPHGRIWYKKKGGNAPAAFVREDAKKITTRLSQVRDKADADLLGLFDGVLEIRYER
jgi:hypothetical protein